MDESPLWNRADACGVRDIAIVGTHKHAGKTTVLGRLLADAATRGYRIGVVSIGVDGERTDHLSGVQKPEVPVVAGTLLATAVGASHNRADLEWIQPLGISSPLGDIWLARASSAGSVLLAGVRQVAHLQIVKQAFYEHGVTRCLIDGALARMMAAQTTVCDGVILATGAGIGPAREFERLTKSALLRLEAEVAPRLVASLVNSRGDRFTGLVLAKVMVAQGGEPIRVGESAWVSDTEALAGQFPVLPQTDAAAGTSVSVSVYAFGGAVTDTAIETIAARGEPAWIVARSPAHLFITEPIWKALLRAGSRVMVSDRPHLLGVAVNPRAPDGQYRDRLPLIERVRAMTDAPIWDVMEAGHRALFE